MHKPLHVTVTNRPPIMIEFATKLLCERGARPDRIYYDKF